MPEMGLDFCLMSFTFVAASHSAFLKVGGNSGPTASGREIVDGQSQKNLSNEPLMSAMDNTSLYNKLTYLFF